GTSIIGCTMRLSHEALPLGDDAPTRRDLFHLASRGIILAKQHGKLKSALWVHSPHTHFIAPPERVITPDVWEAPFGLRYYDRFFARVARSGHRSWKLHIRTSFDVADMGDNRGGDRHEYSFAWNHQRATMSEHRIRAIPQPDDRDVIDEI